MNKDEAKSSERTKTIEDLSEEKPELVVSIAPHVKTKDSVPKIMWTVIACLLPPVALSALIFGPATLILALVSILSCVGVEAICQKMLKRPIKVSDGSAVLTGLLIAMIIPPDVSFALPVLGAVMAILVGKELMGGLGYNIFNPALLARAFLMATFPVAMTSAWLAPTPLTDLGALGHWIALLNGENLPLAMQADALTAATPLAVLRFRGAAAFQEFFGDGLGLYGSFFIGWRPGSMGETSGFLLLLGGGVLLIKRYITWHIPVSMLGMIALLTWAFGGNSLFTGDPLLAIL
ncbi:MAG: RnfABCDGE type electron transport complex subunit D, partial [Bradymonadales bacterium]